MEIIEIRDAVDDAVQQAEIIGSTAQAIYDAAEYSPNTMKAYQMGLYGLIQTAKALRRDLEQIRDIQMYSEKTDREEKLR